MKILKKITEPLEQFLNFFKIPAFVHSDTEPKTYKVLMLLALGFYICLHASMHISFAMQRTIPYEPDDAYTYIVKAEQMEVECFLQDCPALQTLGKQFTYKQSDLAKERLRYRAETRSFLVYHPVHSVVMVGLKKVFGSWEYAYAAISVLGVILMGASICLFLRAVWGSGAAAIGLLLIAASFFKGQGLHLIVPSNMSLGFLFLACGLSLQYGRKAFWWVFICILAMLGLHLIGKVYALIAIFTYFISDRKTFQFKISQLTPYVVLCLPVFVAVFLPHFIGHPVLTPPAPPPIDTSLFEALGQNISRAFKSAVYWDNEGKNSPALIVVIFSIVSLLVLKQRTKAVLLVSVPFVLLGFVGVFYIIPGYPAELFYRIWCALAVLGAGAFGALAIWSFEWVWKNRTTIFKDIRSRNISFSALKKYMVVIGVLLSITAVYSHVPGGVKYARMLTNLYEHRNHFDFLPEEMDTVLDDCGTVFHTGELSLFYYLSHGGLKCPTYYLAAAEKEDFDKVLPPKLEEPIYVVFLQPTDKSIYIDETSSVEISFNSGYSAGNIELNIYSPIDEGEINIVKDNEVMSINLAKGENSIKLGRDWTGSGEPLTIKTDVRDTTFFLRGLKTKADASYLWPWGEDIGIFLSGQYGKGRYNFNMNTHTHNMFKSLEIIEHEGANMLAIGQMKQ